MAWLNRRPLALIVLALLAAAVACSARTKPPASAPGPPAAGGPATSPTATSARPPAPAPGAEPRKPAPGAPPLTGVVTRAEIESFNEAWKGLRAADYDPDPAAVATIRDHAAGVEVFAVVATWCPDTRRDLPRFFKIADQAQWSTAKMKLLAVDRTKKDPGGLTEKWNVTRVPTFIFLRGGREIGRVVERPATTLERDIAEIVERK